MPQQISSAAVSGLAAIAWGRQGMLYFSLVVILFVDSLSHCGLVNI